MLLGPKSLQLGKTWSDAHARVASRTARQRDLAQLPALDRATRASTDRAAGSALATLRGANQRFLMRKPEVRAAFRSRVAISMRTALTRAFAALFRRSSSAAPRTSRRWTSTCRWRVRPLLRGTRRFGSRR